MSNVLVKDDEGYASHRHLLLWCLIAEVALMVLYLWRGIFPLAVLGVLCAGFILFYAMYRSAVVGLLILLFSILPGSLAMIKIGGKTPPLFFLDIAFFMIVLVTCFQSIRKWDGTRGMSPVGKIFILFLLWMGMSTLQSLDVGRSLAVIRNYAAGFVAFFVAQRAVQGLRDLKLIIVALLLWGIGLSLLEFYTLSSVGSVSQAFVGVFFQKNLLATNWGRSNYLAAFDVILIPLAMAMFLGRFPERMRLLSLAALFLLTTALIVSLSKGGLVAGAVALIAVLARALRPKIFVPLVVLLLVLVAVLALNPLTSVLLERVATFESALSFQSRVTVWEESWDIFLDNPLTGVGIGNLGRYITFVTSERASAHNIVLGLLAETGIVGFLLFATLIILTWRSIMQSYRETNDDRSRFVTWGIASAFLGAIAHSMVEPNFEGYQFSVVMWAMLGVSTKLGRIQIESQVDTA